MSEIEYGLCPVTMINRVEAGVLEIEWPTGNRQTISHQLLRAHCRCADCKVALKKSKTDIASVSLVELRLVGAYGAQLFFSDGHNRGIYPWSYLGSL